MGENGRSALVDSRWQSEGYANHFGDMEVTKRDPPAPFM